MMAERNITVRLGGVDYTLPRLGFGDFARWCKKHNAVVRAWIENQRKAERVQAEISDGEPTQEQQDRLADAGFDTLPMVGDIYDAVMDYAEPLRKDRERIDATLNIMELQQAFSVMVQESPFFSPILEPEQEPSSNDTSGGEQPSETAAQKSTESSPES